MYKVTSIISNINWVAEVVFFIVFIIKKYERYEKNLGVGLYGKGIN